MYTERKSRSHKPKDRKDNNRPPKSEKGKGIATSSDSSNLSDTDSFVHLSQEDIHSDQEGDEWVKLHRRSDWVKVKSKHREKKESPEPEENSNREDRHYVESGQVWKWDSWVDPYFDPNSNQWVEGYWTGHYTDGEVDEREKGKGRRNNHDRGGHHHSHERSSRTEIQSTEQQQIFPQSQQHEEEYISDPDTWGEQPDYRSNNSDSKYSHYYKAIKENERNYGYGDLD